MIVLYAPNETAFTTNGLGGLAGARATVHEVLNGEYTCDMVYPLAGNHANEIEVGCYLKMPVNPSGDMQTFTIETVIKKSDNTIAVRGNHISYELNGIPVEPFTATGITATLAGFGAHAIVPNPFTYTTDISNEASTYNQLVPQSARACLGGVEGSLLDVFRGEYLFDNREVRVLARRGADHGVTLRYGKNIIELQQEKAIQNVFTGVVSYWFQDDIRVVGSVQYVPNHDQYPKQRIRVYDATDDFDTQPTSAQLDARSRSYISDNDIGVPKVNLTLNYIDLALTDNFKAYPIEPVSMGDTVHVYFPKLDVIASARVVETVWNVNAKRYDSIVIGSMRSTIAGTLYDVKSEMDSVVQTANRTTAIVQRIDNEVGSISTTISQITEDVNGVVTDVTNLTQTAQNISASVAEIQGDYVKQSTYNQDAERIEARFTTIEGDMDEVHTYITFDANGVTVGRSDSNVRGVFGNDGLNFINSSEQVLAWLSVNDGLGATELSVGDATTKNKRWRLITSEDGSHFRITRHT